MAAMIRTSSPVDAAICWQSAPKPSTSGLRYSTTGVLTALSSSSPSSTSSGATSSSPSTCDMVVPRRASPLLLLPWLGASGHPGWLRCEALRGGAAGRLSKPPPCPGPRTRRLLPRRRGPTPSAPSLECWPTRRVAAAGSKAHSATSSSSPLSADMASVSAKLAILLENRAHTAPWNEIAPVFPSSSSREAPVSLSLTPLWRPTLCDAL